MIFYLDSREAANAVRNLNEAVKLSDSFPGCAHQLIQFHCIQIPNFYTITLTLFLEVSRQTILRNRLTSWDLYLDKHIRCISPLTNRLMNEPPTADTESRALRAATGPDEAWRRGQGEAEARPEFPVQPADESAESIKVSRGPRLPRRVGVPPAQQIQRHDRSEILCV